MFSNNPPEFMENLCKNWDKVALDQKTIDMKYHIVNMIKEGTGWNNDKCDLWLSTRNPHLGNIQPIVLIILGKEEKLVEFIKANLEGDLP